MNPRRLYRCRHDRQLAGVAAGMAEYFEIDPTLVRVLWLLSIVFGGITILLYIVLAFVIPLEPEVAGGPGTGSYASTYPGSYPGSFAGTAPVGLIIGGPTGAGSAAGVGATGGA